jgi:hypothetical protein
MYYREMADLKDVPSVIGLHKGYEWLVTEECLDDLLSLCPQIVMGKFVAITSIDSGHFVPTEAERASGWETQDGIAYSPVVTNIESIPRENWDEWYVFDQPFRLGRLFPNERNPFADPIASDEICVFVNYDFRLHDADHVLSDLFWEQMHRVRPQTFIAESDHRLTVVTSDKTLFAAAHKAIQGLVNS